MRNKKIGLTGNIATGKSTVAHMLRELGAYVIDADQVARDVVEPGQPTLAAIVEQFGNAVLRPDGALDRKALGAIVFNNKEKLRQLESVMQPGIRQALQAAIDNGPPQQVLVLEAIRLIEGGWDRQCDSIWVTTCPAALQVARLMQSRGLNHAEAEARVQAQNPQAEKLARADVIIDTSSGIDDTRRQILTGWSKVIAKSS